MTGKKNPNLGDKLRQEREGAENTLRDSRSKAVGSSTGDSSKKKAEHRRQIRHEADLAKMRSKKLKSEQEVKAKKNAAASGKKGRKPKKPRNLAADALSAKAHQSVRNADQDNNSGVEAAHFTEGSAEGAARAGSRFQYGRKLRQYKKLEQLEKKADKDAVDSIFAERMKSDPQAGSNLFSRWRQKQAIKKEYAAAKAGAAAAENTAAGTAKAAQSRQQTAEVRKQRTRLATAKQRVSELEVLLCKIYEDNILGKLSDSRYATLDAQYEKEQSELTAEISVLEKAVKSYEKHEKDADRFIALIDKYENFDKLTIAMLNEFIEKILVHEHDRKGSIQTTQEVEIYFNFVGRFVPPAFGEVELTPEELEEIRRREERKDRLHQNYLKRKASGVQKRYEDKIKERKKTEIEAKKAAIRAEDIAKGVFVPVSSLPQREPMKGVQTA